MRGIKNKSAIVTGAARGIGLAVVRRLLEEDIKQVLAVDIDLPEPDEEVDVKRVRWHRLDVSDALAVKTFFQDQVSGVDLLVNNAALIDEVDIFSPDLDLWEKMLRNNLTSAWLMTHHCAHRMRATGGAIVNVGSVDAFYGHSKRTGYAAAKGGMVGLTNTTAKQLAPYNIRVNCVVPGAVTTRLTEEMRAQPYRPHRLIARNGRVEELASAIVFLGSDDASFMTGQLMFVDGGAHRF